MTPEECELLQESYARLSSRMEDLLHRFYAHFLGSHPLRAALFQSDRAEQIQHLHRAIRQIAQQCHRMDVLAPALEQLGHRHASYGVTRRDITDFRFSFFRAVRSVTVAWTREEERVWNLALDEAEKHIFAATSTSPRTHLTGSDDGKPGTMPEANP